MRLDELSGDEVLALPLESLALLILEHFCTTSDIHPKTHLLLDPRLPMLNALPVHQVLLEGWQWLLRMGALAPSATQDSGWMVITRAGRDLLEEDGLRDLKAAERLRVDLHPVIGSAARAQFLLGKYESAVFEAMKAVEVRVRLLGGYPNAKIGVALMNLAFAAAKAPAPAGPLTDSSADPGEQVAMRSFFAGAYGVLRNPSGHREVDYDDPTEAAEAVLTASMLMRILDRIELRRRAT